VSDEKRPAKESPEKAEPQPSPTEKPVRVRPDPVIVRKIDLEDDRDLRAFTGMELCQMSDDEQSSASPEGDAGSDVPPELPPPDPDLTNILERGRPDSGEKR
jgi:hypothetical protein